MKRACLLLSLLFLPVVLCQCTNLRSESGLYQVDLRKSYKVDMDGYWLADKPGAVKKGRGSIYIAPLDISRVSAAQPELAPVLQQHMGSYMAESVSGALQKGGSSWTLTDSPAAATVRMDMAVVRFTPQRPALSLAGQVGSLFSPVPFVGTATEAIAGGKIVIEGSIRNAATGELLMAFKDSNRKKGRIVNGTAFSRSGAADASLKSWAHSMGTLVTAACTAAAEGKTVQQLLDGEGAAHALMREMKN